MNDKLSGPVSTSFIAVEAIRGGYFIYIEFNYSGDQWY